MATEALTNEQAIEAVVALREHMQKQDEWMESRNRTEGEHKEKLEKLEEAVRLAERNMTARTNTPEWGGRLSRFQGFNKDLSREERAKAYDELLSTKTPASITDEDSSLIEEIKDANDEVFFVWHAAHQAQKAGNCSEEMQRMTPGELLHSFKSTKRLKRLQDALRQKVPTSNTTETGEGVEWVPTGFSTQITEKAEAELRVTTLFDSFQMPADPFDWPFSKENPQARVVSEVVTPINPYAVSATEGIYSSFSDANPTGKVTFAAKKLKSDHILTGEFNEDAIRTARASLTGNIGRSIARALDDAILNGDDDTTHFDADISESGTDPEVLFRGLRWYGIEGNSNANVTAGGAGATGDTIVFKIIDQMKAMGAEFGDDPNDLALIVSMQTYGDLLKSTMMLTLDKFGPQAVILRGQVGAVLNIPVILSSYMRVDLDTIGYRTQANTAGATTSAILTWRPGWKLGVRRRPTFETLRLVPSDQEYMVSFWRGDFEEMHNTGNKIVSILRNLP